MKFSCKSSDLQKSLGFVEKAVAQRTSLPILENIYLEQNNGKLTLRGNDLEIGIENNLNIEGNTGQGSVLIKAKTISSIMSKLGEQNLNISVNDSHQMVIQGEHVDFDILGTNPTEYPVFPSVEQGATFKLTVAELKNLIKHTLFSVSFDETKQFLNGILIKSQQNNLIFVATDGYRLALKKNGKEGLSDGLSVITPYKAVNELNRILQGLESDKEIEISVSEKQISFKSDEFILISRVIQGQFPDYNQVIPSTAEYSFTLPRRTLLAACERASIIAAESNNVVRFFFNDQNLTIKANAQGMGEFKEDIGLSRLKGDGDIKVAFNVRLVLDALRIIEADDIHLDLNSELSPCKITPVSDDTSVFIIMPIRTSDYQDTDNQPAS